MGLTQMALSGSVLILWIMAVRVLALRRLPKAVFLILWEMAALRLLLPVAIPVPSGPLPLPALQNPQATPAVGSGVLPGQIADKGLGLLAAIWVLGTVVLALWFVIAYVRNCKVLQTGLPFREPAGEEWLRAHPIRRPLELRVTDQIVSPLTYGVFHPVILLPKAMPREALETVLTHEYVHVRRFDALAKLIIAAALCLHWWNPLVWGMYVLADRDMELSCDAAALRLLGGERRRDYAMTLLDLEERRLVKNPLCSYFSENIMKERIESIMKFKKTTSAALAAAVVLTVGATAAFAAEKKSPLPDAMGDTSPALGYGEVLDLDELQSMELEDGSILYAPKGVDLENAQENPGMKVVTYTVSPEGKLPQKDVNLNELPNEAIDGPVEEAALGKLVSVKHSDQQRFSPEAWTEILEKIDAGEIVWED